jgi:parallel beta-helix repeat protein
MKKLISILILVLLVGAGACGSSNTPPANNQSPPSAEVLEALKVLSYNDDDKDPERRFAAVRLGLAKSPSAVDALNAHIASDPDPKLRAVCAWAAGQIADIRSVQVLTQATEDRDFTVRKEAILALANFNEPEVKSLLRKIIQEKGGDDAQAALRALGQLTGKNVDALPAPKIAEQPVKPPQKKGRSFYVDATAGNDTHPGTQEKPLRTLAKAVARLKKGRGDTLFATSGKSRRPFRETLQIGPDQAGAVFAPTIIRNWPDKPKPLVYASEPVHAPAGESLASAIIDQKVLAVFLVNKNRSQILPRAKSRETMTKGTYFYDPNQKRIWVTAPKDTFAGAQIEVGVRSDGIHVGDADHVHIIGFTAAFAQDTGIDFARSRHGLVQNATVHSCDRHGIFFYYSPYGIVSNTEVSQCRYQGISIRTSSHTVVENTYSHDNTQDGILFLYDSNGCVVTGSRVAHNKRGIGFIIGSSFGKVVSTKLSGNQDNVVFDPQSAGTYVPLGRP